MSETGGPEHDFEPVPGLPARLPEDEYIVWQGAPAARAVSRSVLKTRWIAGYFAVLLAWTVFAGVDDGRTAGNVLFSASVVLILAAIVMAMLEAFAWGVHKTTLYTITNRRVVMRIGVALSATFNLPFAQIASVDMRRERRAEAGDIAIALNPGQKVSWLVFWPHVRGWRMARPEPQMIGLTDADEAASVLARHLSAHVGRHHEAGGTAAVTRRPSRHDAVQPVGVAAE